LYVVLAVTSLGNYTSTDSKHWGHRLKIEKYRRYIGIADILGLKYRYHIDFKNWYRPMSTVSCSLLLLLTR